MFGPKTLLNTCAALVLLAVGAVAEDRISFEFDEPAAAPPAPVLRTTPSGRTVRIFRDPAPLMARRPPDTSMVSPPQIAHDPDDDSDMGPSLQTLTKQPEEVGSPFGDERPAPPVQQPQQPAPTQPLPPSQGCAECQACEACDACSQCSRCDECGSDCGCQCRPFWAHTSSVFAESLLLHPRGVDMAYARQLNGNGLPGGSVGVANPDFNLGYRVGFNKAFSDVGSLAFTYSNFASHINSTIGAPNNGGLESLVILPGSPFGSADSSFLTANYNINFQLVDIDFRRLFSYSPQHALNWTLGLRYATLRQFFNQTGDFSPPGDVIGTSSAVRFEGTGLKAGLDGERRLGQSQFSFYGKSFVSVLFGAFHSDFSQTDETTRAAQAVSHWNDDRALPVLEFEVGFRWTSSNGRWRSSTGYYTSYWFNTVSTPQFVQAVQTSDFVNLGQTITFDGIISRLEYCY